MSPAHPVKAQRAGKMNKGFIRQQISMGRDKFTYGTVRYCQKHNISFQADIRQRHTAFGFSPSGPLTHTGPGHFKIAPHRGCEPSFSNQGVLGGHISPLLRLVLIGRSLLLAKALLDVSENINICTLTFHDHILLDD